ncbi:MFS transporter [Clavibacter sepedonicus]|uniref:Integral membrane transport protein n=1 Tax=Clavibacter sepedonicus TaxID=31964 RepID=B0RCN8_CLASE|nr:MULTISPECIES: MFS transporter [Clavibacter]OQJ47473.1 MFS transporter [Clavibacter sepedonicus]OQJ53028.1 MFS transporter [Clavibacter sepedonicus]UUK67048.1 MFS transporter [Clavibacter sepedonicus]CAQ01808.1 putative integral membrane transport protein [Clavibacter sepedonicus]
MTPAPSSPDQNPAQILPNAAEAVADYVLDELEGSGPPPAAEPARVGLGFILIYMFSYFGLNLVMLMPALFSLAYKVQLIDPDNRNVSLGLVLGLGGIIGLVGGPVAGVLSDATRLRWGRRRPWLVGGVVISALGGLVLAAAPNVPVMILGWAVAQLAVAVISAGFNPILAEFVPTEQRGRLGALGGLSAAFAGVGASLLGSFLTGNIFFLFLLPPAVFALGVLILVLLLKERAAPADTLVPSIADVFKGFYFDPRKHRDFAFVFLGKFLLQFGFTFFSTYQLYFLLDRLGYTPEKAGRNLAVAGGVSLLALMVFAVLGGFLSDKLRRRKPFIYGAALLIAGGLVWVSLAPDLNSFIIGGALLSAGTGAFTSVDLAMATDLLPEKDKAGKYMAIYYMSSGIPGIIAPIVAPVVLAIGGGDNYSLLFIFGGMLGLGTIITTSRIRGVR